MTHANHPQTQPAKPNSFITDLGPVLAYVLVFNIARRMIDKDGVVSILGMNFPGADAPLYIGSIVFAVAIVFAVLYSKIKTGQVSLMLWFTAIIVFASVAITLVFKNPTIFKMKPTAINALFGFGILGSLVMGKNMFRVMFAHVYALPEKVWRTLAIRWGVFFLFLAVLNEYIWRNYSTEFWTNFKLIGMLPITLVFTLLNIPLLMKHMDKKPD